MSDASYGMDPAYKPMSENTADILARVQQPQLQRLYDELAALHAENERLRALLREITHDAQTLSQNNMDLRKRNAKLEKVAEAAKMVSVLPHLIDQMAVHDYLNAALAELEEE